MSLRGDRPPPLLTIEKEGYDNHGAVMGPKVMNSVKLAAMYREFHTFSTAPYSLLIVHLSERGYPKYLSEVASHIDQPQLPALVRHFLFDQHTIADNIDPAEVPLDDCPQFNGRIFIYHSATARYYAPSDLCGTAGMHHELI